MVCDVLDLLNESFESPYGLINKLLFLFSTKEDELGVLLSGPSLGLDEALNV